MDPAFESLQIVRHNCFTAYRYRHHTQRLHRRSRRLQHQIPISRQFNRPLIRHIEASSLTRISRLRPISAHPSHLSAQPVPQSNNSRNTPSADRVSARQHGHALLISNVRLTSRIGSRIDLPQARRNRPLQPHGEPPHRHDLSRLLSDDDGPPRQR
jgi:branched-subunit amino acid aminotransferase/4-amino-4-deoxychorismate lyase